MSQGVSLAFQAPAREDGLRPRRESLPARPGPHPLWRPSSGCRAPRLMGTHPFLRSVSGPRL